MHDITRIDSLRGAPERETQKYSFKVAETREELEAAFALLHDSYVSAGLMTPHETGLRLTVFHALPKTRVLLVKHGNRIVGTVSVIQDSPLGLPMESIFDIRSRAPGNRRIAELSSLALHPRYRRKVRLALYPLFAYVEGFCRDHLQLDDAFIAVNPRHIGIYRRFLEFEEVAAKWVDRYDFVNGAPAAGAHVDIRNVRRNVVDCLTDTRFSFEPAGPSSARPMMSPGLLRYFFFERTNLLERAERSQQAALKELYRRRPEYSDVFPATSLAVTTSRSGSICFDGRAQLPYKSK